MGQQGLILRMREVEVVYADSAADVGHIGFEAKEGIVVVVAGGPQIAAEEGVLLLVVTAEFGDAVAAHIGLDDVGGDFNTQRFQFVHWLCLVGTGGKVDDAGKEIKERERERM